MSRTAVERPIEFTFDQPTRSVVILLTRDNTDFLRLMRQNIGAPAVFPLVR